jgi:hypothetical protein
MAYDQKQAERLRKALAPRKTAEVPMFSGLTFMLNGNMLCGVGWEGFLFRVGKEGHAEAVRLGAKPMVMKDRVMTGFVWVDPESIDARALKSWIARAEAYVGELPAKTLKSAANKVAKPRAKIRTK